MPPQDEADAVAVARYRQIQAVSRQVVAEVQGIWSGLPAHRVEAELAGEAGARIVAAVIAGQLSVVQGAQAFLAAILAAQGAVAAPAGAVVAAAFAGIASDGRPLETLLFLPALTVQAALAAGLSPADAMLRGLAALARYAGTQIADAGRGADQVAMTAERRIVMYTRVVQLPACARCIILAGQTYSYSTGFRRHPLCDCSVKPLTEREYDAAASPRELFAQMSPAEQRRRFGEAGADAIRAGADMGQIVNARRGMSTAGATTSEGTTRRGWYAHEARRAGVEFGRSPGTRFGQATSTRYGRTTTPRLMPEEIYRQADGDRDMALRLLRRNGYLDQ